MGKEVQTQNKKRRRSPARSPEALESSMISLAMDQAREQLENHTASSQVLIHFLKLGASIAEYEKEKIKADVELAKAKVANLESQKNSEELLQRALKAFSTYSGDKYETEDEYNEEDIY